MTTSKLRARYRNALRGLAYDNTKKALVLDHVNDAILDKGIDPADAGPEDFVSAIESLRLFCRRCAGTGRYITGSLNGKPTGPGGPCFRCGGHGVQTHTDGHRNSTHDEHAMVRAFRGMMAS